MESNGERTLKIGLQLAMLTKNRIFVFLDGTHCKTYAS